MTRRFGSSAAVALACVLASWRVGAADVADDPKAAAAEQLFQDGRALLERGETERACAKFAESARLDAAPGTLLNLAQCYESQGRIASAWARYKELQSVSGRRGQVDRERFAIERAAALEPRLPAIVLEVVAPAANMIVEQDGVALGRSAWASRLPVDPGLHHVVARAPGHAPFAIDVKVVSGEVRVRIPPLERHANDAVATQPPRSLLKPAGIALTVAGGVALATSLGFGLATKLENDGARQNECGDRACTPSGAERIDRAITYGNVSTGVGIGSVALLAAGLIMWIVGSNAPSQTPRAARSLEARF